MQAFDQCHLACSGKLNFFHCVSFSHIITPFSHSTSWRCRQPLLSPWATPPTFLQETFPPLSAALASSPLQSLTGWSIWLFLLPILYGLLYPAACSWTISSCSLWITASGLMFCFIYLLIWHMLFFLPSQICRPASAPYFVQPACFKGVPLALCFQASSCHTSTSAFL